MPRQTASKLLYDDSYLIINIKGTCKIYNPLCIPKLSKKNFFFLGYIRMEFTSQNKGINAIKKGRTLFNERRSNLLRKETNKIRKKLNRKEVVYNFLKKKEQKDSLTNREKRVLKNIDRYFKNFKKYLEKLQK